MSNQVLEKKQRLNVDMPTDLFKKMKLHTVENEISITDYINELIDRDLKQSKLKSKK